MAGIEKGVPADAVVTVIGSIGGRKVAVIANDITSRPAPGIPDLHQDTRFQQLAFDLKIPLIYLVDSAGAHRRAEAVLPRPSRVGQHLPQPGQVLRSDSPAVRPFRPVSGWRRLCTGALRRRDHGRQEGDGLPGLAADGQDGDRRGRDRGRAGRRAHALCPERPGRRAGSERRGSHRRRQAVPVVLSVLVCAEARRRSRGAEGVAGRPRQGHSAQPERPLRREDPDRSAGRRRQRTRNQAALRQGDGHRAGANGRKTSWDRRQQLEGEGRGAVQRLVDKAARFIWLGNACTSRCCSCRTAAVT